MEYIQKTKNQFQVGYITISMLKEHIPKIEHTTNFFESDFFKRQ